MPFLPPNQQHQSTNSRQKKCYNTHLKALYTGRYQQTKEPGVKMIAQIMDTTNVVPDSLSMPLCADAIRYISVPNTLISNAPTYAATY